LLDILPSMLLMGIGADLCYPAVMTLATSSTSRAEALLADGQSMAFALTGGYRFGFTVAAVLDIAAIVVAAIVIRTASNPPGVRSAGHRLPLAATEERR
jgi:hypothetical protein